MGRLKDIKVREETLDRLRVMKAAAHMRSYDELINTLIKFAAASRWRLTKKGEEVLKEMLREVEEEPRGAAEPGGGGGE